MATLSVHWKDWCWSWNSNTLATWCEELTHWQRPWCWEGLRAGREGDDRGWDGWMASRTLWTWVWVNSRSWWWTGRPAVLRFMGLQRVGHDWVTELNWTLRKSRYKEVKRRWPLWSSAPAFSPPGDAVLSHMQNLTPWEKKTKGPRRRENTEASWSIAYALGADWENSLLTREIPVLPGKHLSQPTFMFGLRWSSLLVSERFVMPCQLYWS